MICLAADDICRRYTKIHTARNYRKHRLVLLPGWTSPAPRNAEWRRWNKLPKIPESTNPLIAPDSARTPQVAVPSACETSMPLRFPAPRKKPYVIRLDQVFEATPAPVNWSARDHLEVLMEFCTVTVTAPVLIARAPGSTALTCQTFAMHVAHRYGQVKVVSGAALTQSLTAATGAGNDRRASRPPITAFSLVPAVRSRNAA
jgi:hypothetical protein